MPLPALWLLLLGAAAVDFATPSTESAEPLTTAPPDPPEVPGLDVSGLEVPGLEGLTWVDYPGFSAVSWMGPASGCEKGSGGARREVTCSLPGGRVVLTFDRAEFSLELRCEDHTFNCSELAEARALLSDASDAPGAPAAPPSSPADPLIALTISNCHLPPESLACLPPLGGARGARLLKIRHLYEQLTPRHLEGFEGVTKLRIEDASDNVTFVPYAAISQLPELTSFSLLGGALNLSSSPEGSDLPSLPGLARLELAMGTLQEVPARAFSSTPRLTSLMLWGNEIRHVHEDAFEGLTQLVNVSLNSNRLSAVPGGLLRPAPRLHRLDLYDNPLALLPAALLAGHAHLEEVVIFSNSVPLALEAGAFSALPALKALRLDSSRVGALPADAFSGARALSRLDLSRNELIELPAPVFRDAPLSVLDLGHNKLTRLPATLLTEQVHLQKLFLGGNRLGDLPEGLLGDLTELTHLDLSDNLLEALQKSLFRSARRLQELDLSGNRLHALHSDTFDVLQSLQVLSVSGNELVLPSAPPRQGSAYRVEGGLEARPAPYSPFSALTSLRTLRLDHNRISAVCEDWRLFAFLTTLDLSHNFIQDVNLDFLSAATVDLRHNNITAVFPVARPAPPPATFLLGSNPYACDCALYPLLYPPEPSVFIPNMNLTDAKCAAPPNMVGRDITKIDLYSLTCSSTPCPDGCSCTIRPATSKYELRCESLPSSLPSVPNEDFHMDVTLRSPAGLTSLPSYVKYLNLSATNLTEVPQVSGALEMDLTGNRIPFVPEEILRHNVTLKLAGNPLRCACADKEHVALLKKYRSRIRDFGNVTCGEGLVGGVDVKRLCAARDAAAVGGALAVLGVAIVVLAATYYRFRLEVRILLKKYGLWWGFCVCGTEDVRDKMFDAFVSHAHQDEAFVAEQLMPRLEGGRRPLRLCVHFRDWVVGDWIPAQITRSVENSRKTIIVLSRHFLDSVWGQLEFRAAHGRDRVVILMLDDIRIKDLDPELRAYISMNTYVRADDPLVWDRLKDAVLSKRKVGAREKDSARGPNGVSIEKFSPTGMEVILRDGVVASPVKPSVDEKLTPKVLNVKLVDGMLVNSIKPPPVKSV